MTKNPVLIRGWKKHKEEQARIKDDYADQIQKIKEYYAEERERLKRNGTYSRSRGRGRRSSTDYGAPTLFPGEGSLQRAEHPTEAKALPMQSWKKEKPSGIFTSATTPKPKKQKKPKVAQTFQEAKRQATSPSCESCGAELKPEAKFCGSCGTRID